jgi:hypothetical protein
LCPGIEDMDGAQVGQWLFIFGFIIRIVIFCLNPDSLGLYKSSQLAVLRKAVLGNMGKLMLFACKGIENDQGCACELFLAPIFLSR